MAGIYLHIPFCKTRCIYCDFFSTVRSNQMADYVRCLIAEAERRAAEIHEKIHTVYVGGGTPSRLSENDFHRLTDALNSIFDLSELHEFTVEVNPDDVSARYVRRLKGLGVNRISMGVQSFVDDELAFLRRRHNSQKAKEALFMIRGSGITNVSIDLIYGIPGQSIDTWDFSLQTAIDANVRHLSAYCLSYEEGTRLWQMRESGKIAEQSDDTCVAMYQMLTERMKNAGFEHYEVSSFSKPDFRSKHNSAYWDGTPYLGLGASAHSYDGKIRRHNPSDLSLYMNCVNEGKMCYVEEFPEWWERYDERVMLRLRTADGLSLTSLKNEFGEDALNYFLRQASPHLKKGRLLKFRDRVYIAEEAFMMSDAVIRDVMW